MESGTISYSWCQSQTSRFFLAVVNSSIQLARTLGALSVISGYGGCGECGVKELGGLVNSRNALSACLSMTVHLH